MTSTAKRRTTMGMKIINFSLIIRKGKDIFSGKELEI